MSTEYKIEVMQAYLDGKSIEFKFKPSFGSNWGMLRVTHIGIGTHWDWNNYDYRVKGEKWINIYTNGLPGNKIYPSKKEAIENAQSPEVKQFKLEEG